MNKTRIFAAAAILLSAAGALWLAMSGAARGRPDAEYAQPPQGADADSAEEPVGNYVATMRPFAEFAFEDGTWAVYFFNDRLSHRELKGALPGTCLVLTDREQVIRGLRALEFEVPTGGDMATVTSALMITRDGKPIYETHIHVSPHVDGIQSPAYGWVGAVPKGSLLKFLQKLKAITRPEILPSGPVDGHQTPCTVGNP